MAAVSSVFSVDYNSKRVLSSVNANDTFLSGITKLTNDASGHSASYPANETVWTSQTMDILPLPVIQVMQSFNFKYIRIHKKLIDTEPKQPEQPSYTAGEVKKAFQLLTTPRRRRLPNKKNIR
jgi:hypothetical protein